MNRLCWLALCVITGSAIAAEERKTPCTDLYGDPLPPGAVMRMGSIRLRHANADVVFSRDGKQLISCGDAGDVRIWDAATGKLRRRIRLQGQAKDPNLWTMALSPDGATAAGWEIDETVLYDARTGKPHGRLPGAPLGNHPLLAFSLDGKRLIVQEQDAAKHIIAQVWDVVAVKKRCVLGGSSPVALRRAVFSPDGKRVAGREDIGDGIHLWDADTGAEISKGKHRVAEAWSLAFSPDGAALAVGTIKGGGVHLLDGATLEEKSRLRLPAGMKVGHIGELAFSPDGKWLAAAHTGSKGVPDSSGVLLWDREGSTAPRCLPGGYLARFAFAPDGKTLAYSDPWDDAIRLVETASGRLLFPPLPGHRVAPEALAVSPDGKTIASGDYQALLYLWDSATGKPLRCLTTRDRVTSHCLFSPDGQRVISLGWNGTIQVWNTASGKEERRLACYADTDSVVYYYAAAVSTGGNRLQIVADSLGESPRKPQRIVWDLTTGERAGQRDYVVEWRVLQRPGEEVRRIEAHAAFTPDGEIMTAWAQDRVRLEEVATGTLLATLPKGVGKPLLFSPDGRLVAATITERSKYDRNDDRRKSITLFETATGEEIVRLEVGHFFSFAFMPEGRGIVTAGEKALCVWDVDTGERMYQMPWPEIIQDRRGKPYVSSLVVLPGGRAATGLREGEILIWDLALSTWPDHKPAADLDRKRLAALWSDLAGDAQKAQRAIVTLTAVPERTLPWLSRLVQPVSVDGTRIDKLLANLNDEQFEVRESASQELSRLRPRMELRLRHALKNNPPLETRRRIDAILAQPKRLSAETVRILRAIAVLERIGTPEAKRILQKLAGGAAVPETPAAQAALRRLSLP